MMKPNKNFNLLIKQLIQLLLMKKELEIQNYQRYAIF